MKMYKNVLEIEPLRSRLALRIFISILLTRELKAAASASSPALIFGLEEALKECHTLKLVIDLLERQKQSQRETSAA
jgi:hypothetical protein